MEIYAINRLSRNGISTKKSIFEVIICVILAIILFILPSDILRNTLVSVFGVILIIIGVTFALVQWKLKPIIIQPDSVEDIIEEAEAEAEAEEESSEKTEKQDEE